MYWKFCTIKGIRFTAFFMRGRFLQDLEVREGFKESLMCHQMSQAWWLMDMEGRSLHLHDLLMGMFGVAQTEGSWPWATLSDSGNKQLSVLSHLGHLGNLGQAPGPLCTPYFLSCKMQGPQACLWIKITWSCSPKHSEHASPLPTRISNPAGLRWGLKRVHF